MKAVLLARVSTDRQTSNSAQLYRLREYVINKKLESYREFEFDESAYKEKRNEFKKVLSFLKRSNEPLALCCDKVDRLIRNFSHDLADLEKLRVEGKVQLHFPNDNLVLHQTSPATDLFYFAMAVALAKYYSDSTKDNLLRKNEEKRRLGQWLGRASFGYLNVSDENNPEAKDVVPDPERAEIAIELFVKYATGDYSDQTLADELEKRGVVTAHGKHLHRSGVSHILTNPFYHGEMKTKYGIYEHRHKPLISKSLFLKVQDIRSGRKQSSIKAKKKDKFTFAGLLKCAQCGCAITAEIKKGRYVYYSCTNAKKTCKRIYVPEKELLAPVLKDLNRIKPPKEKIDEIIEFMKKYNGNIKSYHNEEMKILRRQYDNYTAKLYKLVDIRMSEEINKEIFKEKHDELTKKRIKVEMQIAEMKAVDTKYHITAKLILTVADNAATYFENSEIPKQQELMKYLFQNPVLNGKNLEYELREPFKTLAKWTGNTIRCPDLDDFRTLDWSNIQIRLNNFIQKIENGTLLLNEA